MKLPLILLFFLSTIPLLQAQDCMEYEPAGEDCASAPFICNIDQYCSTNAGATDEGTINSFCGIIENNVWVGFRAGSPELSVRVTFECGTGIGMQGVIMYTNNCTQNTPVSNCNSDGPDPFVLVADDLIVGEIYYIVLDGTFASICNFTFEVQAGFTIAPDWADAGESGSICGNQTIINGSSSNNSENVEFTWFTDDGNIVSGGNTLTPTIDAAGTYGLIVTDPLQACIDTSFASYTFSSELTLSIPEVEELDCESNETLTLIGELSGSAAAYTFLWTDEAGEIVGENQELEVTSPGVYTVSAISENEVCSLIETIEVFGDLEPPNLMINPLGDLSCVQDTVFFDLEGTSEGSEYEFDWTWVDGNINGLNEEEPYSPFTTEAGGWLVQMEDTTNGCVSNEILVYVLENFAQPDSISASVDSLCGAFETGIIRIESVYSGNPDYLFSFEGSDFTDTRIFENLEAGTYSLSVKDEIGCTFDTTLQVIALAELFVDLGPDIRVELGENIDLNPSVSDENLMFEWLQSNDYLSCYDCLNPLVEPLEDDFYILTISNSENCSISDTLEITVTKRRDVFVPNAFSPNNDGINDRLIPYAGIAVEQILSFKIFDRWGSEIFEQTNFQANDLSEGFDGIYKGKLLNDSSLVWIMEVQFIDGATVLYQGLSHILK